MVLCSGASHQTSRRCGQSHGTLKASSEHFTAQLGLLQAFLSEGGEHWEEKEEWDVVIYKENIYLVIQMARTLGIS